MCLVNGCTDGNQASNDKVGLFKPLIGANSSEVLLRNADLFSKTRKTPANNINAR